MELSDLTWDEKVFFAGSLRLMILADGIIEDDEIAWVDRIRDEDRFEEMDRCLDEFVSQMESLGSPMTPGTKPAAYSELAKKITRTDAQHLILKKLEEISLRDGYQIEAETDFFTTLREVWGIE